MHGQLYSSKGSCWIVAQAPNADYSSEWALAQPKLGDVALHWNAHWISCHLLLVVLGGVQTLNSGLKSW